MSLIEVKVPDIGDFKDVEVIELLVKPGDKVNEDQPIIEVESDKASMEIPSPSSGIVKDIHVKVGEKISEGASILLLESGETTIPLERGGVPFPTTDRSKQPETAKMSARDDNSISGKSAEKLSISSEIDQPLAGHTVDLRLWAVSVAAIIAPTAGLIVGLDIVSLKVAAPYIALAGLIAPTLLYGVYALVKMLGSRLKSRTA